MSLSDLLRRAGFSENIDTREYIKLTKKLLKKSTPVNPQKLKEFSERISVISEVFDYINNNAKNFLDSYIIFFKNSYEQGSKSKLLDEVAGLLNIVGVTDNKNAMSVLEELGVTFFYDPDEISNGSTYVNPYSFKRAMWKARRKSRNDLINSFIEHKLTPLDYVISKAAKHAGLISGNELHVIGYSFIKCHLLSVDGNGDVRGSGDFGVNALFINPKDLSEEDLVYGVNELPKVGINYDSDEVKCDLFLLTGYDVNVPKKEVTVNPIYKAVNVILGNGVLEKLKLIGASPDSLDVLKIISGDIYMFLCENFDEELLNEKVKNSSVVSELFNDYVNQNSDFSRESFLDFLRDKLY